MKECFYVKGQECTCGERGTRGQCIQQRRFLKRLQHQCPDFKPKGGKNDNS